MNNVVTRADIIEEARTWKGTPYAHQGRTKGVQVDCVGVIIGVAHALGLSTFDYTDYGRIPDAERMKALLAGNMSQLRDWREAQPGDVLYIAFGKNRPQHLALLTDEKRILHAYSVSRKVVEHRIDDRWMRMIRGAYAFPGVT